MYKGRIEVKMVVGLCLGLIFSLGARNFAGAQEITMRDNGTDFWANIFVGGDTPDTMTLNAASHPRWPTGTYKPPPPVGTYAYVANMGSAVTMSSIISRINTSTYAVDTIAVGSSPTGIAITPDGEYVLVANQDSDTVSVVHAGEAREIMQIPVGVRPQGVAIDHAGQYAYVTNATERSWETNGIVSVIDLEKMSVIAEVEVGRFPGIGVAVSSDDSLIAVPNFNSDTVSVIRKGAGPSWEVARTIHTAYGPLGAKFYPGEARVDADRLLYVACWGGTQGKFDQVAVYDLDNDGAVAAKYFTSFEPQAISFHPKTNRFFVSNTGDDTVSVVEPWNNDPDDVNQIPTKAGPAYGDFTPDGSKFFVPCFNPSPGYVTVINGDTLTRLEEAMVGIGPATVAICNNVIKPYPQESYGINLYASPLRFKQGVEDLTLDWTIKPKEEWRGLKIDISLCILLYVNNWNYFYYTFYPGLKPVAIGHLGDTNAMPVLLGNHALSGLESGQLFFPTGGVPNNISYRFEVVVRYKGHVVLFSKSNWVFSE